jgi:FemAB-related protein (PEP-CTERM system-associated)
MRNALFGNVMLSMPFLIYGGVLACDQQSESALVEHVRECAVRRGCTYAEFREVHSRAGWQPVGGKVAMILRLPDTIEELNSSFGATVRAQVKRAGRENPEMRFGGIELVPDFYRVFSEKMRDLGTPVYHKEFFKDIARVWSDSTTFVVVLLAGKPVAAACLVEYRDTLEIPWAAAMKEYNSSGINMYMYHAVLEEAVRRGCTFFDFGRSSVNSSTYRFKKQWGAQPHALNWYRSYHPESSEPPSEDHGTPMRLAIQIWKSLPVSLTRVLGPPIARHLPW